MKRRSGDACLWCSACTALPGHGQHHRKVCTQYKATVKQSADLNIRYLQAETEAFKGQRIHLEAAIASAEQGGELAIKDANAKLAELEATLRQAKQDMT